MSIINSFLDYLRFFQLFLRISGKMYHSGFAKRAAMIHNIPYAEISY